MNIVIIQSQLLNNLYLGMNENSKKLFLFRFKDGDEVKLKRTLKEINEWIQINSI